MPHKIGIISKETHIKPHKQVLEADGYTVEVLGSSPTSVPPSLDALVIRVVSSSHLGTDVATAVRREGKIPVIFEDSVTRIREKVNDLFRPGWREEEAALKATQEEMSEAVCRVLIIGVLSTCQCFTPLFAKAPTSETIVDACQSVRLIQGHKKRLQALEALQRLRECPLALVQKTFNVMAMSLAELEDPAITDHVGLVYFQEPDRKKQRTRCRHKVLVMKEANTYQIETLASLFGCTYQENKTTKQEISNMPQQQPQEDAFYYKPIHSTYYKAYYKRDSARWSIRGGEVAQRHLESHVDREVVIERMQEMDAAYAKKIGAPAPSGEVKQAVKGRGPDVTYRILRAGHQKQEEEGPQPQPKVEQPQPKVEVEGIDEAAYRDMLLKLREELVSKNLTSFGIAGLTINVEHMHLASPEGVACGVETPHVSKDITKVSCPDCRVTDFYQAAAYALANLTIGD